MRVSTLELLNLAKNVLLSERIPHGYAQVGSQSILWSEALSKKGLLTLLDNVNTNSITNSRMKIEKRNRGISVINYNAPIG